MVNFEYFTPTKVVFGKNAEEKTGELIKAQGCKKVLVHYGGQSAKKSGLLDHICASLEKEGISYATLGGVVPNPHLSKVHEGIELCRKEGVDFILAVGGGSVMSDSSVITNEDGWLKRGCNNNLCRCRFAVMNPELTYTLPPYQTASGCVDIMMHTMERYFTREEDTALTDGIGEALLRTVMESAQTLVQDPENYNARAQVMWASSLSHNGLTGCGTVGDWSCHQLEHELGGMFDVAHGAGLAAVWGSWARYVYKEKPERFAQFAVNVMGVTNDFSDPEKTALIGIRKMEEFYRSIQMPTNIRELGVELTDEQIQELAYKCSFMDHRTIGQSKVLSRKDMEEIYRMAR